MPDCHGSTFTYRFQADLYGTTWWHSDFSSQHGSGLFGPLVIYGPNNTDCATWISVLSWLAIGELLDTLASI